MTIDSINEPGQRTTMLMPFSINEPPNYPGMPVDFHAPPKLNTLAPTSAPAGADVTVHCLGSNFIPTTTVNFNGVLKTTVFVSPGEVTAVVKSVAGSYTIKVQDGRGQSVGIRLTVV